MISDYENVDSAAHRGDEECYCRLRVKYAGHSLGLEPVKFQVREEYTKR